ARRLATLSMHRAARIPAFHTLPLHDALPISPLDRHRSPRPNGLASSSPQSPGRDLRDRPYREDPNSELSGVRHMVDHEDLDRDRSEEHTSELQSRVEVV